MKQNKAKQRVLFQAIVIEWTKRSRGAPGSVARNRVPEAHALPANPPSQPWPSQPQPPEIIPPPDSQANDAPEILLHFVGFNEVNLFHEPATQYWTALSTRLPEPSMLQVPFWHIPVLKFTGTDDGLQVKFSWHEVQGSPSRHHLHMWEHVMLATGQWMQVQYNARHMHRSTGDWYYQKHVLNIGNFISFAPTLFVNGPADFHLTDLADLY